MWIELYSVERMKTLSLSLSLSLSLAHELDCKVEKENSVNNNN